MPRATSMTTTSVRLRIATQFHWIPKIVGPAEGHRLLELEGSPLLDALLPDVELRLGEKTEPLSGKVEARGAPPTIEKEQKLNRSNPTMGMRSAGVQSEGRRFMGYGGTTVMVPFMNP
jgi:hypothetical protein